MRYAHKSNLCFIANNSKDTTNLSITHINFMYNIHILENKHSTKP